MENDPAFEARSLPELRQEIQDVWRVSPEQRLDENAARCLRRILEDPNLEGGEWVPSLVDAEVDLSWLPAGPARLSPALVHLLAVSAAEDLAQCQQRERWARASLRLLLLSRLDFWGYDLPPGVLGRVRQFVHDFSAWDAHAEVRCEQWNDVDGLPLLPLTPGEQALTLLCAVGRGIEDSDWAEWAQRAAASSAALGAISRCTVASLEVRQWAERSLLELLSAEGE